MYCTKAYSSSSLNTDSLELPLANLVRHCLESIFSYIALVICLEKKVGGGEGVNEIDVCVAGSK